MRILLLTAYFKEEARSIPTSYKLARLFATRGNKVFVLTSKSISKNTYKPHKNIKVVESKDYFIKDPLNLNVMPFLLNDLARVIREERPDACIISKYIFFPILAVPYLKLKGVKTIVVTDTYPGVVWFTRSKVVNFLAWLHYQIVGRTLLRAADFIVLSHHELVDPTKRLGIKKYAVIHNGVDMPEFDAAKPSLEVRKEKGEVVITFVGRLASIKGIDTLMQAAIKILKKRNNVRFLLAGQGDSSIIPNHPKIQHLGYLEEVTPVLKASDVFVLPSVSEGLPAAVIEAMACGLPVVASNIPGGLNELVIEGITGLRFEKGNATDLAKKLELLITDQRLRIGLGRGARHNICTNFNNDKIYDEWKSVLYSFGCKKPSRELE
jgi:glycosyltransferase involved in cell wall biosynthesis